ncbi:MAG: hypothetical protein EOS55_10605 [Mesorhizobium sp.]|nr:MAG: hypothetical protein EOS55_10605 [Mesorhizobium sp.]
MRTLSLPGVVTGLALAACDNSTEPTKANTGTVNKNLPVDQDARAKSTTGQPAATVPQNK